MMMSGDQYKGYLDHGKDTPVAEPRLSGLYLGVGVVALAAGVVAVFDWTWPALLVFLALLATAIILFVRLRPRRADEYDGSLPRPGNHPPTDYR